MPKQDDLSSFLKCLEKSGDFQSILSIEGSRRASLPSPALIPLACMRGGRSALILPTPKEAEEAYAACLQWRGGKAEDVALLPTLETLPYERLSPKKDTVAKRYRVLHRIYSPEDRPGWGKVKLLVASIRSFLQPVGAFYNTPPLFVFPGSALSEADLFSRLEFLGYSEVEAVSGRGQAARRNGMMDVFPPDMESPVRIAWGGGKVSSIKKFSVLSQLTFASIEACEMGPCHELLLTEGVKEKARELSGRFPRLGILKEIAGGRYAEGMEMAQPLLDPLFPLAGLLSGSFFIFSDSDSLEKTALLLKKASKKFLEAQKSLAALPEKFEEADLFSFEKLKESLVGENAAFVRNAPSKNVFPAGGNISGTEGFKVLVVSKSEARAEKLCAQLGGSPIPAACTMESGFVDFSSKFALFTEKDLLGTAAPAPAKKTEFRGKEAEIPDLKPGDFVVHSQYGIGRFAGLESRVSEGVEREFAVLEYASSAKSGLDKLYIPSSQLFRISRYLGSDSPKLDKLGSASFQKAKAKAKKRAAEVSERLVRLYAQRREMKGHAFSPDTSLQLQMEASFPYSPTPDQMKAIRDVKEDMESPTPMDRLITGDVGFGKTEIAVRAAFKAVEDGKQVAVLAPTTLLAEQHLETFKARLEPFGARVESLSRFRKAAEAKEVKASLAAGKVDVLVGTQKILSPSVSFKDLGLAIIDEEQRFGVKDKEFLKGLNPGIDVLSLSATPIPRTLEMSLSGIRQVSTLLTPPEERMGVLTYVGEFQDELAAAAISREILRSGQVFYVCRRIEDLEQAAFKISSMLPECRIATADGKMPSPRLDAVINDFWKRRIDVLVCTTIIETGLDIPNANTLIVERSDCYGLAQLHQLRGRVGRGSERAYAYFFHPQQVGEDARERLDTIERNSSLGSGYQIALKDLELRGVGNLVGEEQSGFIKGVGVDCFVRMMKEEIGAAKGICAKEKGRPSVEIPVPRIPDSYIPFQNLRMEAYSRFSAAEGEGGLKSLMADLEDRYGKPPESVESLANARRLEWKAEERGVGRISQTAGSLRFFLSSPLPASAQVRMARIFPSSSYFKSDMSFSISLDNRHAAEGAAEFASRCLSQVFGA